jgi:hypothetical protein
MVDQRDATSDVERRARKRVKKVRDFYGHVMIYLLVNTLLVIIDLADSGTGDDRLLGLDWAYFPLIGWGIFLLIDGLSTFRVGRLFFGADWEQRKLAKYREMERHDPSVVPDDDDDEWF